ncbi:hypothetical protein RvY_03851 [Ramazzottius varieornatus]|uniref:Uncharacterized protein n=1 Tax=Ramazzottius varieornatus TaxID=947166 RepID=A0A1D1USY2_RAMVA|nr:hypothetical protein RvY_03851 [Ramazzottius varieornatus]
MSSKAYYCQAAQPLPPVSSASPASVRSRANTLGGGSASMGNIVTNILLLGDSDVESDTSSSSRGFGTTASATSLGLGLILRGNMAVTKFLFRTAHPMPRV